MKKNKIILSSFLCCALTNLMAETNYWKGGSTDVGTHFSDNSNWSTGAVPTENTDVFIDYDYITNPDTGNGVFVDSIIDNDLTWNSLTINISTENWKKIDCSTGSETKLSINNDLTKLGTANATFAMGAVATELSLEIGGNLVIGQDKDTSGGILTLGKSEPFSNTGWDGPLAGLNVSKDILLYNSSTLNMNIYNKHGEATYSNPDVYVKGDISFIGNGSGTNPTLALRAMSYDKADQDTNSIVSVNSVKGNGWIIGNTDNHTGNFKSNVTLLLNGNKNVDANFEGWIYDNMAGVSDSTKVKIVKDGSFTQTLSGGQMKFSGGIEILNGTLSINGLTNDRDTTNHGDLTMKGGNFEYINSSLQNYMKFENLVYSDGNIVLNGAEDGTFDSILLSGTLKKGENFEGTMNFIFTGEIESLLADYVQILQWENDSNPTDFSESDFTANTIIFNGLNYGASFQLDKNGLNVMYTEVVPEPMTYGLIFGLFGMIALYFRKNK